MTRNQRHLALFTWLSCLGLLAHPAVAEHHEKTGTGAEAPIQVVSSNVQGKNVYIPSTIVVAEGKSHTLSVFNTTDTPHGFAIEGLGIEAILQPGVETLVELPALEDGKIYRIHCQLHPPHRSGQLVVLDSD